MGAQPEERPANRTQKSARRHRRSKRFLISRAKPQSNDVIRTFQIEFLMGPRHRIMEDQKRKPQDIAKQGQNLNQNLKSFQKIVNWERWRVN